MQLGPIRQLTRVLVTTTFVMTTLALVGGAPAEAAAPCQRTFTNSTPAPISAFGMLILPPLFIPMPTPGSGTSSLDVADGSVQDVEVAVHLTHPSVDGLVVTLQHGLTSAVLKNVGGTIGANLGGTTFDDEAVQDVTSGVPPYAGSFRPTQALSAFDGTAAAGTWNLFVSNVISPLTGTIDSWSLTVTYSGTCNYDGDAVEDHSDSCLGSAGQTASGCPLASRGLTAKYRNGKFKGALVSSAPACRASKSVTVWKVRKGPDRMVGTRTTAADGRYRLRRAKHAGRYYATSARAVVSGTAECPAVRSATFRLR